MQVILIQDVKKLGKKGQVFEVSDGYARNYLIPSGLAKIATKGMVNDISHKKEEEKKKSDRHFEKLKQFCDELLLKTIRLKAKSGEGGRLFGSISAKDIAEVVKKETGYDFDRSWIKLKEPIKMLGNFQLPVKYAPDVEGFINLVITADE